MSKSLGGFLFIKDAIKYDYCVKQAIESMSGVCDQIAVVDAGSQDGTRELLCVIDDPKLTIQFLMQDQWDEMHGKEKLSYFQNMAADMLTTDYQLLIQSDEIIHESSYKWIREAINSGAEGVLCSRFNLWGSPYKVLNVPENRMPCSSKVVRLSKRGYKTYSDGESIMAPAINNFVEHIRIYHMGFVRKREVMKDKIIHMQEGVFQISHDPKLDKMDVFDWRGWFSEEDLKSIEEPLPAVIQDWASERVYD